MPAYVIVSDNLANLVIQGGPILWDGVAPITLPVGTHTILASDAGAYSFPARPAAEVNTATLQNRASTALDANVTYLAIPSPSNAQVTAQVNRLTRECSALIRLLLNQTDDTAGT